MVGSPCRWNCEKMCTGRFVDCGPDRKRSSLISGAIFALIISFSDINLAPG